LIHPSKLSQSFDLLEAPTKRSFIESQWRRKWTPTRTTSIVA
jgi:hypothetical protein